MKKRFASGDEPVDLMALTEEQRPYVGILTVRHLMSRGLDDAALTVAKLALAEIREGGGDPEREASLEEAIAECSARVNG